MAKKIPKKAVGSAERRELELFRASTEARHRLALDVFNHQDSDTQEVIERIQDRLSIGANGVVRVWPDGKRGKSVLLNVGLDYMQMNALYVAVEILSDLAMMDVQVANFEFPTNVCSECGVKLNSPRRKKRRD